MKDSDFSNIIYQVVAVRNVADEENTFLYGAQDSKVTKVLSIMMDSRFRISSVDTAAASEV
jgi:hypothetical protein